MSFDVKTRLSQLKSSSKKRKIKVNLDINKYQALIDIGCHYCGSDLSEEKGYCLDRVDSSIGYIISNVVGCCKICNRAKSNMEIWDFVNWLNKAQKHTEQTIAKVSSLIEQGTSYSLEDEIKLYDDLNKDKISYRITYKPKF